MCHYFSAVENQECSVYHFTGMWLVNWRKGELGLVDGSDSSVSCGRWGYHDGCWLPPLFHSYKLPSMNSLDQQQYFVAVFCNYILRPMPCDNLTVIFLNQFKQEMSTEECNFEFDNLHVEFNLFSVRLQSFGHSFLVVFIWFHDVC